METLVILKSLFIEILICWLEAETMGSAQFITGDFTWRELVMLTGVFATLIVGIWNVIINYTKNKKELFVNAITSERVKWMSKLRELSSEYISLTRIHNHKEAYENDLGKRSEYLDKIVQVNSEIKLHLNYKGDEDKKIISVMDEINKYIFEIYDVIDLMKMSDDHKIQLLIKPSSKTFMSEIYLDAMKEITKKYKKIEWNDTWIKQEAPNLLDEVNEKVNEIFKKKFGYEGQKSMLEKTDRFIDLLSIYLKDEWERVKKEANNGDLKK